MYENARRCTASYFFFFNDTATTEIYTLSLHDALPICIRRRWPTGSTSTSTSTRSARRSPRTARASKLAPSCRPRSEEHTSELQSRQYLVCRLLLEKKKKKNTISNRILMICYQQSPNTY